MTTSSSAKSKAARPRRNSTQASKGIAHNEKRVSKRPSKRQIVRWNDQLDNKLLLSIQFACSAVGIRIPWQEVAEQMGNGISEGAIVQHLAKLRKRMDDMGLDVPPPLKRGTGNSLGPTVGTGSSKRVTSRRRKVNDEWDDDFDTDEDQQEREQEKVAGSSPAGSSNDSENEYVACGAGFLHFPNDIESPSDSRTQPASSNGGSTPKKLVTLRIGKGPKDNTVVHTGSSTHVVQQTGYSGEPVHTSPPGAVQQDMGMVNGFHHPAIQTTPQMEAQPQYNWRESNNFPPRISAACAFEQGQHSVEVQGQIPNPNYQHLPVATMARSAEAALQYVTMADAAPHGGSSYNPNSFPRTHHQVHAFENGEMGNNGGYHPRTFQGNPGEFGPSGMAQDMSLYNQVQNASYGNSHAIADIHEGPSAGMRTQPAAPEEHDSFEDPIGDSFNTMLDDMNELGDLRDMADPGDIFAPYTYDGMNDGYNPFESGFM
ncbi:hypothetical protein FQN55_004261 [Onygenales sp. PD_40]|nr:hypothetical protein FQN55_004261 [Onygenales sp. PD_40]KAK2803006.1 hypothetical protein FQN51_004033 [Onygenales sp. PD_10]